MNTAIFLALAFQASVGTNLLSTPGKSTDICKWAPWDGKPSSVSGEYLVEGSEFGETGVVEGITIIHPPIGRHLLFSIKIKASQSGQHFSFASVSFDTHAPKDKMWTAWWENTLPLAQGEWKTFEKDMVVPSGSDRLRIVMHNPNSSPFTVTDIKLIVGAEGSTDSAALALAAENNEIIRNLREKQRDTPGQKAADLQAKSKGAVVNHVHIRAPICTHKPGEVGTVTFPVPAFDAGQIPIAFKVTCDSPGKILRTKWEKRPDGRNYVCQVTLKPGTKGVWVQYDALVLSPSLANRDTKPPAFDAKSNRSQWTRASACVQTGDSEIRAMAAKLSAPQDSTESYARKVFAFVMGYHGKGAPFKALDASAAVQTDGSCTNKANLTAALLREHGIPARTVSHMPTWATGPLYEHWLTEYWQPGTGWVAIDPLLGRWDPDRRTRVVLATANEADEDRAFEPLHERFIMPGAAYMSSVEISPTLFAADLTDTDAMNTSDVVGRFALGPNGELSLINAAIHAYSRLLSSLAAGRPTADDYKSILAVASSSQANELKQRLHR